jgi:HEPN domain-containing protein
MSERIEIARQWLAKARNDLLNVDNNLRAEVIPYDTVCFHCQQAAEKVLIRLEYVMPEILQEGNN